MANWQSYLEDHQEEMDQDLVHLLSIPSVSTLPHHATDVQRAAQWVATRLERAGVEHVQVLETGGHPVVYGDWLYADGELTVLIYGHYDVQPAEPFELWTSDPFTPRVEGDLIFARGASDMKGNLLLPIAACEALLKTAGKLPINVKFLFEGEEEIGSPSLADFMSNHKDLLACDMMASADSGQLSLDRPAIEVGLRGLCAVQVDVRSAGVDLHSGMAGGLVHNAAQALVEILASLKRLDGRVLVTGFYDDVAEITPEERQMMDRFPVTDTQLKAVFQVDELFGEPGFSPVERNWVRPTLDINGLWAGFQGEGVKTVIPAEAHAKITCRLVPNQTPEGVLAKVKAYILERAPRQVKVSFTDLPGRGDPYRIPSQHLGLMALRRALSQVYGVEPLEIRIGASVPVTAMALKILGVYTVPLGMSLNDEHMHAPDEFYRISNFHRGQAAYAVFFTELARK